MSTPESSLRVLVCAPIGRDNALTVELLTRAHIACLPCRSLEEVCLRFAEGAGAILLTEEALSDRKLDALAETLAAQPPWSDISVLLFAGSDRDEASLRTLRKLEVLRNVTLLDRPVRTAAVISAAQAALRGRQRQYELRDVLRDLERARTEAENANRLKDEFLATVSHELRTPLNAILGWVSLLRQASFDEGRISEILEIIERNARSQTQIVADVLDISRMVSGRVRLSPVPVSLARIVRDALDTIRPTADAKRITLSTALADEAVVQGDPERLQQVFWNVLSNACKFTPSGGRIDVTLVNDGGSATVRVTDSGIGIEPDFLPHVFDRFRQADQSFTRTHGGLGLGLAIVKHLVEMHGGEVRAASNGNGTGATFEIRLRTTLAPLATIARRRDDRDTDAVDLNNRLVLVVDDDEATRELLRTGLGRCRARVEAVSCAADAVVQFDWEVPDVIVADIGMPGEDGLSLMRRIRARPAARGGNVPAIALSAYARAEDRDAALAAGFDAYLTKPATAAAVAAAVRELTARRPAAHPPAADGEPVER